MDHFLPVVFIVSPFQTARPASTSLTGYNDLQVFAGHDHSAIAGAIEAIKLCQNVAGKGALGRGLQSGKSFQDRAVVGLEYLQPMLRRTVTKHKITGLNPDGRGLSFEHFIDALPGSPQRRRLGAGRRREVLANGFENLADETSGRPVGQRFARSPWFDWAVLKKPLTGRSRPRPGLMHMYISLPISAQCLGMAGKLSEARGFVDSIHKLNPGYRVDDFLAAFRLSAEAEALFRKSAKGIGLA